MEQTRLDRWHAPLKAPAVEVIDLLSDDELLDKVLKEKTESKERDASDKDSDSEGSQSSLWEDILDAEEDDAPLHGGLYSQLERLGLADPQEVFDIGLFREDPSIFYQVAKDIIPSSKKYSPTHAFIRLLQDKGKLLTNFTQNIDNLEGHAGIRPDKLIQCHGSFATATCIECKYKVPCEKIYYDLKAGKVAKCDRCIERIRKVKPGFKRKRSSDGSSKSRKKRQNYEDSTDDEDDDIAVAGVMKPCSHVDFDIDLLGDCDSVVTHLCRRAGWDLQHEMIDQTSNIDVKLQDGYESRFSFKLVKA
ncbi:hypothetical protein P7C71_g6416, partial [Lecanoromycetidae sp. Uapishka_2]